MTAKVSAKPKHRPALIKSVPKQRFYKSLKFWTPLAAICIGYLAFRQIEMRIQKAEFKRAEAYVEETSENLKHNDGLQIEKKKQCVYASTEYGKGRRSCVIRQSVLYLKKPVDEANELLSSISAVNNKQKLEADHSTELIEFNGLQKQQISQDLPEKFNDISCHVNYDYFPLTDKLFEESVSPQSFIVTVTCGGSALGEYYPVFE